MKTIKTNSILAVLALLAATGPGRADEINDTTGWYGGLNIGQSLSTIKDARIASSLAAQGFTQTQISKDTRDIGYKVFGGYQFGRHFALEAGYFDLGRFGFTAATLPPGTLSGRAEFRGVNLDAVAILALTDRLSAFGRAGVHYTETKTDFLGTGAVLVSDPSRNEKAANYKVGAGLEYALTPQFGLRAELERYRAKDGVGNTGDIDLASIGAVYRFKSRAVEYAPQPAVAAAPPQDSAALPPIAATPPIKRSLTLSTDSQFDFDRAVVKPDGRRALDRFANDLKGSDYSVIIVKGHTDRLGSESYNADLSLRRADAVKSYLVDAAAIPPSSIDTQGLGESVPVTEPGDCPEQSGVKRSLALIDCLQRDRRVELEAIITK